MSDSCSSCNDYVHLYSRLGYKTMKLIQTLTRVCFVEESLLISAASSRQPSMEKTIRSAK